MIDATALPASLFGDDALPRWQQRCTQAQHACHTVDAWRDAIGVLVQDVGFEHFSYGIYLPQRLGSHLIKRVTNAPAAFMRQYVARHYMAVDPRVHLIHTRVLPFAWGDPGWTELAPQLWLDQRDNGVRYGWTAPLRDSSGVVAGFTVARRDYPLEGGERLLREAQLMTLAQAVHARAMEWFAADIAPFADELRRDLGVSLGTTPAPVAPVSREALVRIVPTALPVHEQMRRACRQARGRRAVSDNDDRSVA